MSSAYSTINNYADLPVYSPDVDFVIQGLQFKQQQYDHNREKLQTYFDQIASVDLAKDVDKQYFEQRLEQVKEIADRYMSGDLSRSSVVNSVTRNLNQILDKNVTNAIVSTKRLRSEQKAWDDLKEKSPDKFNEMNYAYSMQNASQWLNDGEVGKVYTGGAGVIEDDKTRERILKELPNQIKNFNDKWIETAPGSGMFYDIVTKEAVPREKVNEALELIIGDKGYNQLQIEAWYKNRESNPEAVKSQYKNYLSSELSEANEKIANIESILNNGKETDPNTKGELERSLSTWKTAKATLETQLSDNNLSKMDSGTMAATMYINNFKNGILNAYSKDPHIVDRKIDQNHLETVKHQFNVEKFEKEFDLKEREFELKLKKEEREAAAAAAKAGKGAGGMMIPGVDFLPGSKLDIGEGEGYGAIGTAISMINKSGYQAIADFKNAFGNKFSSAQMVEIANKMPESFSDVGGVWEVELDGRKHTFDLSNPDNVVALEKFRTYIVGTDPATQEVRGAFKEASKNMINQMTSYGAGGIRITAEQLPNFGVRIVGDATTGFRVERVENGAELYKELVQKKINQNRASQQNAQAAFEASLTEAEEKTLEMFGRLHFIADEKLGNDEKREAFMGLKSDMYNLVGTKGVKALPQTVRDVAKAYQGGKLFNVEIGGKNYRYNPANNSVQTFSSTGNKYVTVENPDVLGAVKEELQLGNYSVENVKAGLFSVSAATTQDMSSLFPDQFKSTYNTAKELATSAAEKGTLNMSQRPAIFTSDMPMHSKLLGYLEMSSNVKDPIVVQREIGSDGKPTGNYKAVMQSTVLYKEKEKYKLVESDFKTIDATQAQSIGLSFETQGVTPYDISYNRPATKSLGSSKLTEERKMFENFAVRGVPPALDMTNRLVQKNTAETYGGGQAREIVSNLYNKYDSGAYTFKLEPTSGVYTVAMYEGSKRVHFVPYRDANGTPKKVLAIDEVAVLEHNDATMWKSEVFTDYVENNVMNALMNRRLSEFIQN
jgi:hypothetical protein